MKRARTTLQDCVGFLSAVAPCETYSLGSRMIKVQISRIMCSQLERADHLAAKSYMWNTMTQLGSGSKASLPKSKWWKTRQISSSCLKESELNMIQNAKTHLTLAVYALRALHTAGLCFQATWQKCHIPIVRGRWHFFSSGCTSIISCSHVWQWRQGKSCLGSGLESLENNVPKW